MRAADVEEVAAFGRTPKEALRVGLRSSVLAATAFVGDRPEAMFGLTPVNAIEGVGRPWLLGTDVVPACARALIREGAGIIEQMHRRFARLENWVSARNVPAIALLERWGFTVEVETRVIGEVEFRLFWREAGDV